MLDWLKGETPVSRRAPVCTGMSEDGGGASRTIFKLSAYAKTCLLTVAEHAPVALSYAVNV